MGSTKPPSLYTVGHWLGSGECCASSSSSTEKPPSPSPDPHLEVHGGPLAGFRRVLRLQLQLNREAEVRHVGVEAAR